MMAFTCPECGRTSHHPEDERHGYCGNCHRYTRQETAEDAERRISREATKEAMLLEHAEANKHDLAAHAAGGGFGLLVEDCPACLDIVVARCDCWPEAALRAAPAYAVRTRNHHPSCPVSDNPSTRA